VSRVVQHPLRAFLVALAAVSVLSIMDAVMKHLVLVLGIIAVSIWRALANFLFSLALYLPRHTSWPSRKMIRIHVARAIVVTIMATSFFWGIARVPLAQAISLTFIAPLIALLLAAVFLKERIGSRSVFGSILAFAGVVVIVLGQARAQLGPEALLGTLAILLSGLTYAINIVMMRRQALSADPFEINFFQSGTVTALWVLMMPLVGVPALPTSQWPWIVVAAIMSTSGTLLFAWAYARGEASYLAVTEYSAFLWASALGWIVFRESVSLYTLAGAGLIVTGCLIAATRKVAAPPEIDLAA
jgi:drug/metabolite transporter (DMT)-like permease